MEREYQLFCNRCGQRLNWRVFDDCTAEVVVYAPLHAINSEKDDLHRYNDPDLLDSISLADRLRGIDIASLQLKQECYWFWQEFIAESISKYVSSKYDAEHYNKKPDHIDWNPVVWDPVVHYLDNMLDAAVSPFNCTVDEYALAHYFANLFIATGFFYFLHSTTSAAFFLGLAAGASSA